MPKISFITLKDAAVRTFHETMAQTLLIYISFFVAFACILAFGVTYNAARIALSERGRELATLRVLGFTARRSPTSCSVRSACSPWRRCRSAVRSVMRWPACLSAPSPPNCSAFRW